jgi:hypothetical protein
MTTTIERAERYLESYHSFRNQRSGSYIFSRDEIVFALTDFSDSRDVTGQKVSQSGGEMSHLHEAFEFVIRQAGIIADNPEGSFVKTVAEAIERKCREAVDGGVAK